MPVSATNSELTGAASCLLDVKATGPFTSSHLLDIGVKSCGAWLLDAILIPLNIVSKPLIWLLATGKSIDLKNNAHATRFAATTSSHLATSMAEKEVSALYGF
jgi:hypothetical protein